MDDVKLPASTHIGRVRLRVASLPRALAFYQSMLGLVMLDQSPGRASLGAAGGTHALVELVEKPGAIRQPVRAAGLYHTAFLLPSRADVGHALRRVAEFDWPLQGAADHAVSEALYLADPDGNGVEIYADRPRESWPLSNGEIAMSTMPLDIESLLAASDSERGSGAGRPGFPAGSTVGHIHLRVPSVDEGRKLFVDVIGLDVTASGYPGALFMSAGGYHHHVAVNIWEGRDVPPLADNAAGLIDFELVVPDKSAIDAIAERARNNGLPVESIPGGAALTHAGGIRTLVQSGAGTSS